MRRGKWTFGVGGGGVLGYINPCIIQKLYIFIYYLFPCFEIFCHFLLLCRSGAASLESVRTKWEFRIDRLQLQLARRPLWKLFRSASEFLPSRVHFPIPNHLYRIPFFYSQHSSNSNENSISFHSQKIQSKDLHTLKVLNSQKYLLNPKENALSSFPCLLFSIRISCGRWKKAHIFTYNWNCNTFAC